MQKAFAKPNCMLLGIRPFLPYYQSRCNNIASITPCTSQSNSLIIQFFFFLIFLKKFQILQNTVNLKKHNYNSNEQK